jgi:hypothetical protein
LREWKARHEPSAAEPGEASIEPLERAPPIVPQSPAQLEVAGTFASESTPANDEPAAPIAPPIDPIPAPRKRMRKSAAQAVEPAKVRATPSDEADPVIATPKRAKKAKRGKESAKPTATKKSGKKQTQAKATKKAKAAKTTKPAKKTKPQKQAAKRGTSMPKAAAKSRTRTVKKAKKNKAKRKQAR